MKTTVRGVRYNSDGATKIGTYDSVPGESPQWSATLYRQPRGGRYFLVGHGDAMTIFQGKAKLIPLHLHDAISWSERYIGGAL